MKKLLWIVCLAATAAFPAAARADGIAFAGVAYGGSGVASLDERLRYVTLPLPHQTMLLKIDGPTSPATTCQPSCARCSTGWRM